MTLAASPARADADNGSGPGGDGSLQLLPDVITNSGISVGGSADFPVKAALFLPEMNQRADAQASSRAAITDAVRAATFTPHPNPLFTNGYSEVRNSLFADYAPQFAPAKSAGHAARSDDLVYALVVVAALPTIAVAVVLGRRDATRRARRDGRSAH